MGDDPPLTDVEQIWPADIGRVTSQLSSGDDPNNAVITSESLETRLTLFQALIPDTSQFVSSTEVNQWLSTYLNQNPNSWPMLRNLLWNDSVMQFYNFPPSREHVARAEFITGTLPSVTRWKDLRNTATTANDMVFKSTQTGILVNATSTCPMGVLKQNLHHMGITNLFWMPKGTFFMVYSWPVGDTPSARWLINSRNGGTGFTCTMGHVNWDVFAETTVSYPGPSNPTFMAGVPYIVGFSWDFTLNPPRFVWVTHNRIIEHLGPNVATELIELDAPQGLVSTPTTSVNFAYSASAATGSRSAVNYITLFSRWNDVNGGAGAVVHYFASWDNFKMDLIQARTIHSMLYTRYCVSPFTGTNRGLDEE